MPADDLDFKILEDAIEELKAINAQYPANAPAYVPPPPMPPASAPVAQAVPPASMAQVAPVPPTAQAVPPAPMAQVTPMPPTAQAMNPPVAEASLPWAHPVGGKTMLAPADEQPMPVPAMPAESKQESSSPEDISSGESSGNVLNEIRDLLQEILKQVSKAGDVGKSGAPGKRSGRSQPRPKQAASFYGKFGTGLAGASALLG